MSPRPDLAVVTGCARGIGAATAVRLARAGRPLVLVDACAPQRGTTYGMPTEADLAAVAAACGEAGSPDVQVLVEDVASAAFPAALAAVVDGRTVGAAVAVAGVIASGPGWATPDDAWDVLLGVNLHGTRRLAEATVPGMRDAGHGRFVAVASAAALRAMPELSAYSAAKAAVAAYVRALAADLAGSGVTANVVCPGSTRGVMLEASAEVYALDDPEVFAAQQLLRRLLEPDEVAAAIAWLCSDDASALTGAIVPVDGGLTP
ncbi:MAG: putative oxidoreductase protein [Solirubrobacterales bacterium]|nr:putative oxidoreductase protein [Solirubrobacterales bacterium]